MNFLIPFLAKVAIPTTRFCMYILFGTATSIAWLLQFLRLDKLSEPRRMILKIFFWGAIVTVPVFLVEFGGSCLILGGLSDACPIKTRDIPPFYISILYWFLIIAFVEETFKYLVVRGKVLKHNVFDEPVDAMIYMIIAALGFAALENILYLLPPAERIFPFNELFARTLLISFFRFIGATFLHALCSGLVGYFLAISICKAKKSGLIIIGIFIATLLHGLYNFSIMEFEEPLKFIFPIAILLGLAIFVAFGFKKLKKMKSTCVLPEK